MALVDGLTVSLSRRTKSCDNSDRHGPGLDFRRLLDDY
jgi:hypothetical protein